MQRRRGLHTGPLFGQNLLERFGKLVASTAVSSTDEVGDVQRHLAAIPGTGNRCAAVPALDLVVQLLVSFLVFLFLGLSWSHTPQRSAAGVDTASTRAPVRIANAYLEQAGAAGQRARPPRFAGCTRP